MHSTKDPNLIKLHCLTQMLFIPTFSNEKVAKIDDQI